MKQIRFELATNSIRTRFDIRGHDGQGLGPIYFIIRLSMQKIGSAFSLFHSESLLSKIYRRDTRTHRHSD